MPTLSSGQLYRCSCLDVSVFYQVGTFESVTVVFLGLDVTGCVLNIEPIKKNNNLECITLKIF